jgi:tRNA (adenine57-N1/adenine58-N1)-methyltransferase
MKPEAVVLLAPSGAKHFVPLDRETSTIPSLGVVRAETLRNSIGRRWTVGDRSFLVLTPSIRDLVDSMRREAQIVGSKDAPAIVWNCDLKAGDLVVEGGAGSGALTLSLARFVRPGGRIVTYDIRSDFLDRARANVGAANLQDSVAFKVGDIRAAVDERDVDAFILDIPDPWAAIRTAATVLRPCGHFASYSPNNEQVSQTVAALRRESFVEIRTVEIIEREIVAQESGTRPSFAPLGHTGYLTFARKVLDTF